MLLRRFEYQNRPQIDALTVSIHLKHRFGGRRKSAQTFPSNSQPQREIWLVIWNGYQRWRVAGGSRIDFNCAEVETAGRKSNYVHPVRCRLLHVSGSELDYVESCKHARNDVGSSLELIFVPTVVRGLTLSARQTFQIASSVGIDRRKWMEWELVAWFVI